MFIAFAVGRSCSGRDALRGSVRNRQWETEVVFLCWCCEGPERSRFSIGGWEDLLFGFGVPNLSAYLVQYTPYTYGSEPPNKNGLSTRYSSPFSSSRFNILQQVTFIA